MDNQYNYGTKIEGDNTLIIINIGGKNDYNASDIMRVLCYITAK